MNSWIRHKVLGTVGKVAGLSVRLKGRDEIVFQLLIVEKQKGKIIVKERFQDLDSYIAVQERIPKGVPLLVNIEGSGVLVKKVAFNEEGVLQTQVVNDPSLFVMHFYQDQQSGFVSIIRKEKYEEIANELLKLKLNVITVRCNPFISELLTVFPDIDGVSTYGGWEITFENRKIVDVKTQQNENNCNVKIGDDILNSGLLLSYADCLSYFTGDYDLSEQNDLLLTEYCFKKMTVIAGWFVLGALLLMLSVNFMTNDSLRKDYNVVNNQYDNNKSLLLKLEKAEKDLKRKEELIQKGGLSKKTYYAWIADKAVSLMPSEIVLKKFSVNPLAKKIQANKEIITESQISVEGESFDTRNINTWMERLKKEQWVKDVEMVFYKRDEISEPAVFNLKLLFDVE